MFLDGKDLRPLPIEERRAELRRLIPRWPKSRQQFSDAIEGSDHNVFAAAEQMGLEASCPSGSVRITRAGASTPGAGLNCWTESALVLIGTESRQTKRRTHGPA
jgi:bifunctional non-homologous end joining protein LigD